MPYFPAHHAIATFLRILFLGAALALAGCEAKPETVQLPVIAPSRLPAISLRDSYPDGQTAEEFWEEEQRFLEEYKTRLTRGEVSEGERAVMRHLLRREAVRRAAEEKVREYNRYAKETNLMNGYR